jgi:hypothetical protein
MSGLSIIGVIICIYIVVKTFKDAIQINNKILELKSEIIKINSICETLELSKICIIFNYNKLANITYIFLIIIILIDIILFIICLNYNPNDIYNLQIKIYLLQIVPFIFIISLIIILLILYLGNKYNNKAIININEIENLIRNKKDDIDKKYIDNLLMLLDTSDDINNLNLVIDEYISNYSYLHNYNKYLMNANKDKKIFIIELERKLIQKKNNELTNIMNTRLKTFQEITHELVKCELEELNKKLYDYKKYLLIKIIAINEQSQINAIIINIH